MLAEYNVVYSVEVHPWPVQLHCNGGLRDGNRMTENVRAAETTCTHGISNTRTVI
jgi:hypothetical protein